MRKKIFILVDYRFQLYFSTRYRGASADIEKLKQYFSLAGFDVIVRSLCEIDLRNESYRGEWVIYQSSEDPDLYYKDFIEDVLLSLHLQGARLIPEFKFFRAHHNKVFMEFLRDLSGLKFIQNMRARAYGTYEEFAATLASQRSDSRVLKPSSGTRSRGVCLVHSDREKKGAARQISRSFTLGNAKLLFSKLHTGKPYTRMSNHRRKFIAQDYVPDIAGDYRVLAYGRKFYVVYRGNRPGDFRASGSGLLDFDKQVPDGLLDYAKRVYEGFDVPYMSLDIGVSAGTFYLFEFQFLCLGQYTLEKSTFFYEEYGSEWRRVSEKPDLEREIVTTIVDYIARHT